LGVPEYRLRALINKRLGYRNFNALLHEYRLRDACAQLADPAKAHLPILTIALDVGYQSIAPFNQAFRDAMGCTPSAYRREHVKLPQSKKPFSSSFPSQLALLGAVRLDTLTQRRVA
jgi:AraC-like DNA-binding protein